MIRRQVGDEFWLITQDDHAHLSGRLAAQFGANGYAAPDERTARGISLHDCGWPLHDDRPTLNGDGLPLDVFETTRDIGLMVWSESAQRAAREDAYAGLLVSLHSLSLSVIATNPPPFVPSRIDLSDPSNRFRINQFQQAQVELQERVRQQLGMRIDQPRKFGLAETSADPREMQLIFDFRLLQAMDKLSLNICCTNPPAPVLSPLPAGPGQPDRPLQVARPSSQAILVSPWPFKLDHIRLTVPFRRLPARPLQSEQQLRDLLASAAPEGLEVRITPE